MAKTETLPRLIFCLTPGRSGTAYLTELLKTIPGVYACHEGKPDFVDWARAARRDQKEGERFWLEHKLPKILDLNCDTYIETSHLFGKGFVAPLLNLGIVPDVIRIDRKHRDVALSFWRKGSIPTRSPRGVKYLLHPEQAIHCPIGNWWNLTDYQACYWYTLEMYHRMNRLETEIKQAGGVVYSTSFLHLTSSNGFEHVVDELNLPEPDADMLKDRRHHYYNATPRRLWDKNPDDIEKQEQEVIKRMADAFANGIPKDTRPKIDIVVLSMGNVRRELMMAMAGVANDRRFNTSLSTSFANPTSNNRNQICKEFVDNERRADWVGMIDEDTIPNGDFLGWVESDFDVIAFVTPCWKAATNPESPIVWNVQLDPEAQKFAPAMSNDPDLDVFTGGKLPNERVIQVPSAGTGAMLIHRRVLEHPAFRAPFEDEFNEFGIRITGHDLAFCHRANEHGFKVGCVLQNPSSHFKEIDLLQVARLMARK